MAKKKRKLPGPSRIIFNILNYGIFGVFTFLCIYPLWYVFIYTISDPLLTRQQTVILYPLGVSLSNLSKILQIDGLGHAVMISVLRTVLGTCTSLSVNMLLGYIFSKQRFPGRTFLYRMLIVTMYIHGGMIPTYLVMKMYGFVNSFFVYIIPFMISAYYVILIKTFIEQIPPSLEESAFLDGAGYLTVLWKIIFPMTKPIGATIALYAAVYQWNSWFDNHIYAFGNKNITTLQYLLYKYLQQAEKLIEEMKKTNQEFDLENIMTPFGVKMAVTFITVVPILLVYPFLQRYIVKGIMVGAVKG